jgi:hypothetical protein
VPLFPSGIAQHTAALVAVVSMLFLTGCNPDGIHPVKGQVVWKDTKQPATELANSLISFEQAATETSARGQIQADGSFQVTTNTENDGAKVGEHIVLIIEIGRLPAGGPDSTQLAPGKISTIYATPGTSNLRAQIKPGLNEVKLEVERFDGK